MLANLDRQKFIDLLDKLGDQSDDEALTAARDLHAQLVVSGLTWDDLLLPEEPDLESEEPDLESEEPDLEAEEPDLETEVGEFLLSEEEIKEALALISQITEFGVSKETREELEDYKTDINDGEFEQMDLSYLRALHKRLAK